MRNTNDRCETIKVRRETIDDKRETINIKQQTTNGKQQTPLFLCYNHKVGILFANIFLIIWFRAVGTAGFSSGTIL